MNFGLLIVLNMLRMLPCKVVLAPRLTTSHRPNLLINILIFKQYEIYQLALPSIPYVTNPMKFILDCP